MACSDWASSLAHIGCIDFPADFRMQVNQMSRASLTLEILVSGNNLRVISGMNFNNNSTP